MAEVSNNDTRTVKVQSSQGDVFDISLKAISMWKVLEGYCSFYQLDGTQDTQAGLFPVEHVNSRTLKLVIQWCEHECGNLVAKTAEESKENGKSCERLQDAETGDDFVKKFFDMDRKTLADLMTAADYLHCESLLKATGQAIAELLDKVSIGVIRDELKIPGGIVFLTFQ